LISSLSVFCQYISCPNNEGVLAMSKRYAREGDGEEVPEIYLSS
jgi:hypothetical protein